MHWLLFIHKILFSSTCFEPQVLHLQEVTVVYMQHMVLSIYTWVLTQAVYRQATTKSRREWQYHMLRVYNCILLKMSSWGSKHVEEINILWINNNQCIKLVINIQGDSGGICNILGNDSMCDSEQKSSYKHVSDFGRLRSYDRLKLRIEGNDYWQ